MCATESLVQFYRLRGLFSCLCVSKVICRNEGGWRSEIQTVTLCSLIITCTLPLRMSHACAVLDWHASVSSAPGLSPACAEGLARNVHFLWL
jgi:hypothetical protein